MNRGNVLQSSPVQQMIAGGPNGWWSMMATTRPSTPPPPQQPFYGSSAQPHFFPHQYAPPPTIPSSTQAPWHNNQEFPDSLSQLLMSGLVSEDDKSALSHMQQVKRLENWEQQLLLRDHHRQQQQHNSLNVQALEESSINQENSVNYGSSYGQVNSKFQGTKPSNWSNQMIPVSSPTSCVSSLSNNMLDLCTTTSNKADGRHPPPDRSSECNSTATGGASKKAKIQPSSNQSTTFKVRKEKLGDRITALHQLVSPFGKTDTASVLLEAIGYIRFLQSQIEALSVPYLGGGSVGNMRNQHSVQQGERNCLFPEDPGQLVNDSCMKMKGAALDQNSHEEPKKDLRSRGLCLVPVSCTMHVGSDNGADYWAPALNGGFR